MYHLKSLVVLLSLLLSHVCQANSLSEDITEGFYLALHQANCNVELVESLLVKSEFRPFASVVKNRLTYCNSKAEKSLSITLQ